MCSELCIGDLNRKAFKPFRIALIRNLSIAILLAVCGAAYVFPAKHPVPLDEDIEGAKCLQCHENKTKEKSIHTAVKGGCLSCHEVRVTRDVTRVRLKTATPVKLCIQCHSDKDANDIKGRVHSPAVRECLKCHDPHTSDNQNHLRKPVSGAGKDENICLTCHQLNAVAEKGGSRHAALDVGCDICHTVHKTGEKGKREFDFQLKKDTPALCLSCHDTQDPKLIESHQGQPFASAGCLPCHDPHRSSLPKLKPAFVHLPFEAGKDGCTTCHQPPKDGKVVLTAASPKELCLMCHSNKAEQIQKAKVQHPGAAVDCAECHDPHAGKAPGFPKPDAVNACLRCHSDQAKQGNKKHLHQPAFTQGCSTCHEPHGGENGHLLRTKTVNSLCLECHGPDSKSAPVKDANTVKIFNGRVRLPESYFSAVPAISIKYGLGHPIERHPVVDQMDPGDVTKVRAAINCGSCHQPHASAERNLLVNDQVNNIMFCASCHKEMGK